MALLFCDQLFLSLFTPFIYEYTSNNGCLLYLCKKLNSCLCDSLFCLYRAI